MEYIGDSWLVKIGEKILPAKYILADSYYGTLNNEEYAERDANRDLHRDVIAQKPSAHFTVPSLMEPDFLWLMQAIKDAVVEGKYTERKLAVTCWIPEAMQHMSYTAYMPDTAIPVRRILNGVRRYQSFDMDLISY